MMRISLSKVQGIPLSKWVIATLALLLIPLLLWLGIWQLQRADEKQQLLDRWNTTGTNLTALPEPRNQAPLGVSLTGRFVNDVIYLLDNRTREGRPGYEVVAPFKPDYQTQEDQLVLVNLGWIVASQYRDRLPDIHPPRGVVNLSGRLVTPSQTVQLHPDIWQQSGQVRIQQLDMVRLARRHPGLYPAVIRLDKPLLSELRIGWPVVNMLPERHIGYAVQWFGLAIVLIGGCIWLIWHRKQEVL